MKYASYTDYRESLLAWAGPIPAHWQLKKVGHLALLKSGENIVSEEIAEGGEYPVYGGNGFRGYFSQYTHDGDFVLIGRQGALCGNINYANGRFWASEHALVAHALTEFDVHWFGETLRAMNLNQYSVSAAQPGLAASAISALRVPFPPLKEQQTIARFLDAKTAQIDALVAQKQQLIDKLKEKRSALIARTVTRGLPPEAAKAAGLEPHPEMKDSGVDWLGQIPSHWECKPIKHLGRIGNGSTPARDNSDYWEDGSFPWLNSSMVNEDSVSNAEEFVTASALRECHLPIIKPPAILIGITGQGRTRGMATTLLIEATINQHVAYVKPMSHLVDVHFLRRVFDNAYFYLRSESDGGGSTKGAITCDQIANLNVPLPPRVEQQAIAAYLDRETTQLEALAAKVESAITSLTEYRQALITSAVTGKIDVRESA